MMVGKKHYWKKIDVVRTDWYFLEWIYHGLGKGMSVYYDGVLVGKVTKLNMRGRDEQGQGHFAIGRRYAFYDYRYASVMVDELRIWDN